MARSNAALPGKLGEDPSPAATAFYPNASFGSNAIPDFGYHRFEFSFVSSLLMVFRLILNIVFDGVAIGTADAERPYPSCHANSIPCSRSQHEELALKTWIAFATGTFAGKATDANHWISLPRRGQGSRDCVRFR
jgi:hypothetical protein